MCGVVGYQPMGDPGIFAKDLFASLMRESSIRGLHAFGIAQKFTDDSFIVNRSFTIDDVIRAFNPVSSAIAHTRYSTSGDWRVLENNQPILVDELALVFNGVLHMGTIAEMEADHQISMTTDNDGEIFLRCRQDRITAGEFIAETKGSFAGLWFDIDGKMYVGRNKRRPLWWVESHGALWYASTRDIFVRAGFPEPIELAPGVYDVQDLLTLRA